MSSHYERTIAELSLALSNLLDALPQCQSCETPGTREDCNCLLVCDADEHGCLEDGGPRDVQWGPAVRAARRILEGC